MAVYYKFKSAKDYDSIPIDGHFITVLNLKEKIFESKHLGRGTDFDLVVTNAQTNEEYLDEATLVPKNTSVLIRRVPGRPRMPIITQPVIQQDEQHVEANKADHAQPANSNNLGAGSSVTNYPVHSDYDDFGSDLYALPEAFPAQISNPIQDAAPPSIVDEDSKIKALIETPALDWPRQSDGYGPGRGFHRGGGRMMGGRGFGRGGFEKKTPPPGYVCHRCNQPGHFIQHCPTNGVPEFDVKRVKPPTGIPKSMLMATPDGSYALPSGDVAVLKPNEAVFEREIEGLPSKRPVGDLPPEYLCPLCKEVMKDAVLTTKCCFTSFCDKCIRDHIINKSVCVCGDNHVLADDLVPNKTLRDSINRTMETNNSSTENGGSAFQVQDMESKMEHPRSQQKVPSPTHSAASKGNQAPPLEVEESSKAVSGQNNVVAAPENTMEKDGTVNVPDVCEATNDSMTVKEHASHGSGAPLADDETQQKPVSGDTGKKKKKKKVRAPPNEMQWRDSQDFPMENNYMMPMGPYNPYWNGIPPPGMDGFYPPFGGQIPPFMGGYGPGPFDIPPPFGLMPQDPFGVPNMMMQPPPFPPQRDLAEMGMNRGMGMNVGPPHMGHVLSREEFEARKADVKRKREIEKRGERDTMPRGREFRDMSSNGDVSSQRPKSKLIKPPSNDDHTRQRHYRPDRLSPPPEYRHHRSERPSPPSDRLERDPDLPRPSSKRKSSDPDNHHHRHREDSHRRRDHHHRSDSSARSPAPEAPPPAKPVATSAAAAAAAAAAEMDRNHKASVFSRISFPTEEQKMRKSSSSADVASGGGYYNDHSKKAAVAVKRVAMEVDDESSEEDRHFKRRPARYEPSPPSPEEREDSRRSRGGTKEREREHRHR